MKQIKDIFGIKEIASYYGKDKQGRQLIEEMAELTVAVNKYYRADVEDPFQTLGICPEKEAILEEIADVKVMLAQIEFLLGFDEEQIYEIAKDKINKQIDRIKDKAKVLCIEGIHGINPKEPLKRYTWRLPKGIYPGVGNIVVCDTSKGEQNVLVVDYKEMSLRDAMKHKSVIRWLRAEDYMND